MNLPTVRAKCLGAELTDDLPSVWQGRALRFQVGLFVNATTSHSDFSDVAEFRLFICRDRDEATPLLSATIAVAGMDTAGAITAGNWDNGSAQHMTFALSGAQMNIPLVDSDDVLWWSVEVALTSGETITAGGGWIFVREDAGAANVIPGPIYVSVTDGVASVQSGGGAYSWPVSGTTASAAEAAVYPAVSNGIASIVLGGHQFSWVVSGTPGNAAAGPVNFAVVSGIATMGLGGISFTFPVFPTP